MPVRLPAATAFSKSRRSRSIAVHLLRRAPQRRPAGGHALVGVERFEELANARKVDP